MAAVSSEGIRAEAGKGVVYRCCFPISDVMKKGLLPSIALEQLRAAGLRPTRQRVALARLLLESGNRHVTAEQLHNEAQAASIRVSLATVYNTLHQFTDRGILREVVVEPGRSYFDTNIEDHHHFFCESTGRLQDVASELVIVGQLPPPPIGTEIRRVDVIIRIREGARPSAAVN
jgi:Fur family transcriptional regulator, iron response regulator